jgi:predicted acetylornithine/succinylornithine family transaminase
LSTAKQLQSEASAAIAGADALLKNYKRYPVNFVKGEGAYLYDSEGKKYLDFLSGIAVTGLGHCHPKVNEAAKAQLESFWHVSNLFQSPLQEELAEKLVSLSGLDNAFFCNSGTEANEAAIKFARKWGNGKATIITAIGGFHGRTMGSLSASAQYKLWEGFSPLTPGFVYVPYNDVEAIEYSLNENTVAIMVEPIQGESGINVPSENYLKELKDLCVKHNLLLILDEVQTGMGRTGKIFAYQWEDIKPDIVTLAKGIANGLPLGAVICTKEIGDIMTPGSHGSTFGGNPVAVASANAVVDLLTEDLLTHVHQMGEHIKKFLKHSSIKEVRGKGLIIGVEFEKNIDAKAVASKLLNNGIVAGTAGENVLRLLPPFIINEGEVELFMSGFQSVMKSFD